MGFTLNYYLRYHLLSRNACVRVSFFKLQIAIFNRPRVSPIVYDWCSLQMGYLAWKCEMRFTVLRLSSSIIELSSFLPTDGRINGGLIPVGDKSCRESRVRRDTFRSDNSRLVDIKCVYTPIYFWTMNAMRYVIHGMLEHIWTRS